MSRNVILITILVYHNKSPSCSSQLTVVKQGLFGRHGKPTCYFLDYTCHQVWDVKKLHVFV